MDIVIVSLLSALIIVAGTLGASIFNVLLKMAERLKGIEMRVEGIEGKVKGIEVQVEGLAEKVGGLEVRMGGLEARMDGIEGRTEGIEKDQKVLTDKLDELLLAQKSHSTPAP